MAGVGLMVEVVAHELARASENTLQTLETLRTKDVPDEVKARLDTLRSEMRSVSKRLRILDPLSIAGRQRSEIFDLSELIEDVKSAHAAQFSRQGLRFEIDKPKVPIRIRAVKGMIVQILENLISNSVYWTQLRATREAQYIPTIRVRIEDNPVTLHFSDNGRGVSQANREKVFRPFWSLKEKTKRRGLGLFIARECATYLGGTLILSGLPDKETGRLHEFVLELPDGVAVR
jgi:signal transduction histidine kinase